MTRDDFLAGVHRLAEELGVALWSIVERQTEAAKATALEVAMGQLRSEIAGGEPMPSVGPEVRRRAARRCSTCRETGHDARRCGRTGPERPNPSEPAVTDQVATPTPTDEPADPEPASSDEPEPDEQDDTDDDEDPSAAPSPPPCTSQPLRPHRGSGRAPAWSGVTWRSRSRTACFGPSTRATTCRRRAGRWNRTGARSTRTSRCWPC